MAKSTTTQAKPPETVIHGVQHVELPTSEPAKLRKFLEKQFGWTFETFKMPGMEYHSFRTPGGAGGGVFAAQPGQPIQAVPYVNVADCEATLKGCQKNGAEILMPVTEVPGQGKFFQFRIPGGPIMACWQQTGTPK